MSKRGAAALIDAKPKRVNWGKGEHLKRLTEAVEDWDAKRGPHLEHNPELPLSQYAEAVGIPYQTMNNYACKDVGKRRKLGSSVGAAPLFSADDQQFAVDVVRRHDRGNDGLNKRECIDILHDLMPAAKRAAVGQTFDRVIRPNHKEELTGIVKANTTTVKRTAITVAQQYRWHEAVDQALAFLRTKNTGLTPDGKTFGEVIDHFVFGGDETCFLASAGDVKIIGDKEKPKHDLPTGSSRTSATIYRVGSAAGATGPTAFLPPGKLRKVGYTDAFLVRHGAPIGSTIVMTPTGYMTEEAWLEMAPSIASGIRQVPVVVDNPDWWTLKMIDGFGAHTSSEKAMEIYAKHKIVLLKEEADTSHACQMYDQKVAIDDKKSMRQSLAYLRQSNKLTKGTIDGWALIHVALAAVRELSPDSWIYSANKVNLKPSTRVPFGEWCARISHYLQGGESSFKPEVVRDAYTALSPFWHGMDPAEKQLAVSIVESHEDGYSVACVKELIAKVHVPMLEMQNLRIAIELAIKDRSHLERGKPEATQLEQPAEVQAAKVKLADVTAGLISFQVHPKAADGTPLLSGIALFDHMIKMGRRSVPQGTDLMPRASLNVEYTQVQQRLINPRPTDYTMHEIAKHAHGEGAKQAMAKRKLDNLGYIRGDCGLANDPERVKRLKNQLGLTESLAAISKEKDDVKAALNSLETAKLIEAAPEALKKLEEKGGDLNKITMTEMAAIAFKHFKGISLKGNKASHIKELTFLIKQQPGVLPIHVNTSPTDPLLVPALIEPAAKRAKPAAQRTKPAAQGKDDGSEDNISEDSSSENDSSKDDCSEDDSSEVGYNAECILAQRGAGKSLQFLVDWEGFGEADRTWESLENVKNCDAYKAWCSK